MASGKSSSKDGSINPVGDAKADSKPQVRTCDVTIQPTGFECADYNTVLGKAGSGVGNSGMKTMADHAPSGGKSEGSLKGGKDYDQGRNNGY